MKIIETLTIQQRIEMLNGSPVGLFNYLIVDGDPFFSSKYPLCLGYYTMRSGLKTISPTYESILEMVSNNQTIVQSADSLMAQIIRGKYLDKWVRVYNALIAEQYNPLDSFSEEETRVASGNDLRTYDTTVEDNGNTNTKLKTTTSEDTENGVYGFNSPTAVPNTTGNGQTVESVEGDKTENTTQNTETKTGTENLERNDNHTVTRSGRREAAQDLIVKELDVRNTQIFYDIVYKDIDSVTALSIYI